MLNCNLVQFHVINQFTTVINVMLCVHSLDLQSGILVACVYRPPDTTIAASQLLIQHLAQINEAADNRIILGDFNFPHIDWTNPSCIKRDGLGNIFQAALDDMGLFQCVTKPTHNNHILDLALLSDLNCLIVLQTASSNII